MSYFRAKRARFLGQKINRRSLVLERLDARLPLAGYAFTSIATTGNELVDFPDGREAPSINDSGLVAFQAEHSTFGHSIFTGQGQQVSRLDNSLGERRFSVISLTAINNSGNVVVAAAIEDGESGVFTTDGESFDQLISSATNVLWGNPSINASGEVTFSRGDGSRVFVGKGSGTSYEEIFNSDGVYENFIGPHINDNGEVAVQADFGEGRRAIQVLGESGVRTVFETDDTFYWFWSPTINNNGDVAVVGWKSGGEELLASRNTAVQTIADSEDEFKNFHSDPAINNLGVVAFAATLDSEVEGIFTGPDTVDDKVIATGDQLLGQEVIDLAFARDGFNDAGQIGFWAKLADGVEGIFRATPIPDVLPPLNDHPPIGLDRWWATVGDDQLDVTWTVDVSDSGEFQLDVTTELFSPWHLGDDPKVLIDDLKQVDISSFSGLADLGSLEAGVHTIRIQGFDVPEDGVVEEVSFRLRDRSASVLRANIESMFIAEYPSSATLSYDVSVNDVQFFGQNEEQLIDLFAPTLRFTTDETYTMPLDVDSFLSHLKATTGDELAKDGLGNSEDWLDLIEYVPDAYNQDEHSAAIYGAVLHCQPQHQDCTAGSELAINYYYFFPRSNWEDHKGLNTHEGDWEGITVFLDSSDGVWSPREVGFSQHIQTQVSSGGDRVAWENIKAVAEHPVVFVGLGGHASYPSIGTTNVAPLGYPEVHTGQITTGPYSPSSIINLQTVGSWINYPGRWGNPDLSFILPRGDQGPRGPKFDDRWLDPWDWRAGLRTVNHSDLDGVEDRIESADPNFGDGNHDGILDKDQPDVTSLPDPVNNSYVTLVTSNGTFRDVSVVPIDSSSPATTAGPIGLYRFSVGDLNPSEAITVEFILPQGVSVNSFYQYGPTPDNPVDHWYEFLYDGTTGADVASADGEITVHYVDGLRGDHDLEVNGVIVDPGAPVFDNAPWNNHADPHDVNRDKAVSPVDALIVVNDLNSLGSRTLPLSDLAHDRFLLDSNADGSVSPIDVLVIINTINDASAGIALGEGRSIQAAIYDAQPNVIQSVELNGNNTDKAPVEHLKVPVAPIDLLTRISRPSIMPRRIDLGDVLSDDELYADLSDDLALALLSSQSAS